MMKEELNLDKEILFYRYCAGIATEEEKESAEKLIATSEEACRELEALQEVIRIEKQIHEVEACDYVEGYAAMRRKINQKSRKKHLLSVLSRAAAILAIPLLVSTLVLGYMALGKQQAALAASYVEVKSASGLVTCLELPDKSKVWLNSGSILRYPSEFTENKREVELEGEGFFEVESDPENPFYVNTVSGIRVMAHGTQFNVNTKEETIETVLAEGKVKVLLRDKPLRDLSPGEESVFDVETNKLAINKVNIYEKTAWKEGKIIFRNAPLNDVFKRLSLRYNVDIILHDEHNIVDKYSARVTFAGETIQQIFAYLEIAAPIWWKLSTPEQNSDSTLAKQRIDVWLIKK